MTETNQPTPAAELVQVTSIPQFAAMVAAWHENICAQLRQCVEIPADVEILFTPVDGEPERAMTIEEIAGFKAGMVIALSLFEELPFEGISDEPATVAPEVVDGI